MSDTVLFTAVLKQTKTTDLPKQTGTLAAITALNSAVFNFIRLLCLNNLVIKLDRQTF